MRRRETGVWCGEAVFYFVPGIRYVRAIGMTIFGDTAFLDFIVVVLLPLAVFTLCRHFFAWRTSAVLTTLFLALTFSDYAYFGFAYAEPLGYLFALLGIGYVLAAMALGWSPVLLLALHNWWLGGQLVLFTSSASVANNFYASPWLYVLAPVDRAARTQVLAHLAFTVREPAGVLSQTLWELSPSMLVWPVAAVKLAQAPRCASSASAGRARHGHSASSAGQPAARCCRCSSGCRADATCSSPGCSPSSAPCWSPRDWMTLLARRCRSGECDHVAEHVDGLHLPTSGEPGFGVGRRAIVGPPLGAFAGGGG
jgi:hypothetical protein